MGKNKKDTVKTGNNVTVIYIYIFILSESGAETQTISPLAR